MARTLNKRERTLLILSLVVILVYAGYGLLYRPGKNRQQDLENKIKLAHRQLREDLKTIQLGKTYEERYRDVFRQFQQRNSDDEVMSSLVSDIEHLAGRENVHITEMKPQKVKKEDFYNQFSVSLTLEGELAQILRFLYFVQNDPHFFNVDEIHLEKRIFNASVLHGQMILTKFRFL